MTLLGGVLFAYLIYSVGLTELIDGIRRFGWAGFGVMLLLYLGRMIVRSFAWNLSVNDPFSLRVRDTLPAVIIGEAMSSVIPLGILISGTAKAVAVRHRVPMVVGLSSVATENLFYSLVTSIFLILGSLTLVRSFPMEDGWVWTFDVLIAGTFALLVFLTLMVVRQWHFASEACEKLYQRGIAVSFLETWRMHVRLFENLIFSFYREHPRRFAPIIGFEIAYHLFGITEVYYMLSRLTDTAPSLLNSFLLESVSRLVTILFKLIPFTIGVDEAGSQFVSETVAIAAGVGVTLAVLRKARMLFWTFVGLIIAAKRGVNLNSVMKRSSA